MSLVYSTLSKLLLESVLEGGVEAWVAWRRGLTILSLGPEPRSLHGVVFVLHALFSYPYSPVSLSN